MPFRFKTWLIDLIVRLQCWTLDSVNGLQNSLWVGWCDCSTQIWFMAVPPWRSESRWNCYPYSWSSENFMTDRWTGFCFKSRCRRLKITLFLSFHCEHFNFSLALLQISKIFLVSFLQKKISQISFFKFFSEDVESFFALIFKMFRLIFLSLPPT